MHLNVDFGYIPLVQHRPALIDKGPDYQDENRQDENHL